jgi:purine-binding chemotaxis protein CheW
MADNLKGATRGVAPSKPRGGKCLTFALGQEEFAAPILTVREIIGFMDITAVPQAPAHVRGVINLRGRVISVIDLRSQFGMSPCTPGEQTCIIVIETNSPESGRPKLLTGVIVDRVGEVINISDDDVEATPSFGAGCETDFITGMAKVGKSIKILLDIDAILNSGGAPIERDAFPLQAQAA